MKKKLKKVKGWAGMVDGKVHDTLEYYGNRHKLFAVYIRKADAKKNYEEVIPVTIVYHLPK